MKLQKYKSIKLVTLMNGIVLLTMLLTLGIGALIAYQIEKDSLFKTTLEFNQMNAEKLADTTNSIFLSMKKNLSITAGHLSTVLDNKILVQNYIDLLLNNNSNFNSVFATDPSGNIIAISPHQLNLLGQTLTSEAAKQALELKIPLISEPYLSMSGRKIVLISFPLFNENQKYVGFLGGTIYLQESNIFLEILGRNKINSNGSYVYVIDSGGRLIYHPQQKRLGESVLQNEVVKRVVSGENGNQRVINTLGIDFLAGFATVHESGWGIVSQTPTSETLALTRKMASTMLLYTLPFFLLLLGCSWWIGSKLSKPLEQLSSFAKQLYQEKNTELVVPRIQHWNYEANELSKAIHLVVKMLQTRVTHLSIEAQTDPLTGLFNRRTMNAYMKMWIEQQIPFSLIILDLDYFKKVNDSYGHHMGDQLLTFLAEKMMERARSGDVYCRYGGEEFVILLPRTNSNEALIVAERIRGRVESAENPIGTPVTASLGIASFPIHAQSTETLFIKADRALYHAKQTGRNKSVIYSADLIN